MKYRTPPHLEPYDNSRLLEVLEDLKRETKIQDTIILPGQTLNGSLVLRVNSLYNESFLLKYNATPVSSKFFEKTIEALRTVESFNYSVALLQCLGELGEQKYFRNISKV
jgi:hypothetical protein